jgi:hypothetical protein
MLKYLLSWINLPSQVAHLGRRIDRIERLISATQHLCARQLELEIAGSTPNSLSDLEFRVSSQFGDDGIISYLVERINPPAKKFIEFGVEAYTEANTRYLLEVKNWSGLIIDGDFRSMRELQKQTLYWRHDLTAVGAFITRENINDLFVANGFSGDIGLLSIDIDGVDYWVWEAINSVNPSIVIAEYNSVFGSRHAITVPYSTDFRRSDAHWSNLYWGASLGALEHLAKLKGYALIGCNSAGNNCYFVREDLLGLTGLQRRNAEEAFVSSKFRESRDSTGRLSFLSGNQRMSPIKNLEVVDVTNGSLIRLRDLPN